MAESALLAAACDIFYTRGKAVAWFNAICAALGLQPSDILQKFCLWLTETKRSVTQESDCSDAEVVSLQVSFLIRLFSDKKVRRYLPLVLDLVRYHQQYAAVLLAPRIETAVHSDKSGGIDTATLELAPSAHIVRFTYDIEELLQCGEPRILRMYEHLQQSGSQAVIYRNNGGVYTESLAEPYILILERIRDGNRNNCAAGSGLDSSEITEFLIFALEEGILVNTR
jgi:hypothetical protein